MSHHDFKRKDDTALGFIRRYWHLILTVMLAFSILVSYRGKVDRVESCIRELEQTEKEHETVMNENQKAIAVINAHLLGLRHDLEKVDKSIHELILVVKKNGNGR